MSLLTISGKPRAGKNLTSVYLAKKHYLKENTFIKFKKRGLYNNVYSNFPILLDRKKKIFSNKVTLNDLKFNYRFLPNSLIIIDEMQFIHDSLEYKTFPEIIGKYLQTHGHYFISDIILISQHPKRIPNKPRDLAEVYIKVKSFKKLPLLPIGYLNAVQYYQFEDYGKPDSIDKKIATYDFDKMKKLCFIKDLYVRYCSTYLYPLVKDLPLLNRGTYDSIYMSKSDIISLFYSKD